VFSARLLGKGIEASPSNLVDVRFWVVPCPLNDLLLYRDIRSLRSWEAIKNSFGTLLNLFDLFNFPGMFEPCILESPGIAFRRPVKDFTQNRVSAVLPPANNKPAHGSDLVLTIEKQTRGHENSSLLAR